MSPLQVDFSFSESFSFFNEKEKDDTGFGIRVGPCDPPTTQKTKKDAENCILFVFDFAGIDRENPCLNRG